MTDLTRTLKDLRRPRILVSAARKGMALYRRDRDLRRILSGEARAAETGGRLLAAESRMEAERTAGNAGYSIGAHIAVLTALMAEASLSPARG